MTPKETTVTIRLADAAPDFVKQALDLLTAVEDADPILTTRAVKEQAEKFRAFIERERGRW